MKRYLLRTGAFALPLILAVIALEVLLRQIPNRYTVQRRELETFGPSIDILVLGNSHADTGIDATTFPCNTFKAANAGQNYDQDLALLTKHIDHLTGLRWLIISASYGSLRVDPASEKESWRFKNYVLYHGLWKLGWAPKHFLEVLNQPLSTQWKMITEHLLYGKDNRQLTVSKGSQIPVPTETDLDLSSQTAVRLQTSTRTDRVAINTATLQRIIDLAKSRNIRVAVVTFPVWPAYRKATDPRQMKELTSTMEHLAAINPNVVYLTYFEDADLVRSDFGDGGHLSIFGRKKLTEKLALIVTCDPSSEK